MTSRFIFCVVISILASVANGQYTLMDPLVCHDKNNYLRCYNDGHATFTFKDGSFSDFKTNDGAVYYSHPERKIVFLNKQDLRDVYDTIEIIQLPKSILLRKGSQSLEINSLEAVPDEVADYGLHPYLVNNFVHGFTFWSGDKFFKLEIQAFWKKWSWALQMTEKSRMVAMDYNGNGKNRLQFILIRDTSLRYGMNIFMRHKSLKKMHHLSSVFFDTLQTHANGEVMIGPVQLEKYYEYQYDKNGKLKTTKPAGELKLCDCD